MVAPARRACFKILQEIEFHGRPSDAALHGDAVNGLSPADKNLVTEITYGTLRWRGWLDYILAGVVRGSWKSVDARAKIALRASLYQMARMSRVPDYAAIDDAVELVKRAVKKKAAVSFVNGVLRGLSRERPWMAPEFEASCPPWIRVSLPEWLWERWRARFGEAEAAGFAQSLNHLPDRAFWDLRSTPGESLSGYCASSDLVPGAYTMCCEETGDITPQLRSIYFQDEASQLIPHLFGDVGGWRIWDACAAPGGKSGILLRAVQDQGLVVSSDLSFERSKRLRDTLGIATKKPHATIVCDASLEAPFRITFDAVLVDVPCSGLGTLRRNPEIKWRFSPKRLNLLHDAQRLILERASKAVCRGGLLLYSTCSTEPEENEDAVNGFLGTHPEYRVRRPSSPAGIECWLDAVGFVRTFPSQKRWDGFFAALMARIS